jgi:hypothetical protein
MGWDKIAGPGVGDDGSDGITEQGAADDRSRVVGLPAPVGDHPACRCSRPDAGSKKQPEVRQSNYLGKDKPEPEHWNFICVPGVNE